jgi:transcription factor SPT20
MPSLSPTISRGTMHASPALSNTTTQTIQPTRTNGSLRQRRESTRPGLSRISTRASTAEVNDTPTLQQEPVPLVRDEKYLLRKWKGQPPSFAIHLYPTHFKLNGINDNWLYDSPMGALVEHLRHREVPHDFLEELYESQVPWYDGCLIVVIYNHRHVTPAFSVTGTNQVGGNALTPFSVHNFNEHITPSPFIKSDEKMSLLTPNNKKPKPVVEEVPNSDKENMPAPNQSASAMKASKEPKPVTVVLFPTHLSLQKDIEILARTQVKDYIMTKRNSFLNPFLPSTPLSAAPNSARLQNNPSRMCIDASNIKEFESSVLIAQNPVLFLEPAADAQEMFAVQDMLRDSIQNSTSAKPKTRKRTVAEVEADEAQAEKQQLFILSLDDLHSNNASSLGSGEGAPAAPQNHDFKRLKVLESIKNEAKRKEIEKTEKEARNAHTKSRMLMVEEAKRREMALKNQQQQQVLAQQQAREKQMQHLQMQQQMASQKASSTMPSSHPNISSSAGQMNSPIIRQQTPLTSSPVVDMGMSSTPMIQTNSNPGAGSPLARPQSANMQHVNGISMTRQMSQQIPTSTVGTPQMPQQHTPNMSNVGPVRHMTPQPRMTGSPVPGQLHAPPMMMTPSQQQQLTPDQMVILRRQQQARMGQMMNLQGIQNMQNMNGGPLTPQQQMNIMQLRQQQMQQQQHLAQQQQQQQQGQSITQVHAAIFQAAKQMARPKFQTVASHFKNGIGGIIAKFNERFPDHGEVSEQQQKVVETADANFQRDSERRIMTFIQQNMTEMNNDQLLQCINSEQRQYEQLFRVLSQKVANVFNQAATAASAARRAQMQQQQQQQMLQQQQLQQQTHQQQHQQGQPNGMMNQAALLQAMNQQGMNQQAMANNPAARQYMLQLNAQRMANLQRAQMQQQMNPSMQAAQQQQMRNLQAQQNMLGMNGMNMNNMGGMNGMANMNGMNGINGLNAGNGMMNMQSMQNLSPQQQQQLMQQIQHMQQMQQMNMGAHMGQNGGMGQNGM